MGSHLLRMFLAAAVVAGSSACADEASMNRWVDHFKHMPPASSASGVCEGRIGDLPSFTAAVDAPGRRTVRVSLPFAPGAMPADGCVTVRRGDEVIQADLRPLTYHAGNPKSVRRGILTFPFNFPDTGDQEFALRLAEPSQIPNAVIKNLPDKRTDLSLGATSVEILPEAVTIRVKDGGVWTARLIAPARTATVEPVFEIIENGAFCFWVRLLLPDDAWPRILEVRADAQGAVAVQAHVQRLQAGDGTAPDLGWEIEGPAGLQFPTLDCDKRGKIDSQNGKTTYYRCLASENVPMQEASWRRAGFVAGQEGLPKFTPLFEMPMRVKIHGPQSEKGPDLAMYPVLASLSQYTRDAIAQSTPLGDDFGNVTGFEPGASAYRFGMNRLNHCPSIFREYWRTGDARLRDTAVLWCGNMYDLSLWWGDQDDFGGMRYNNIAAQGKQEHAQDRSFMWRSNNSCTFCTKGFETFLYAYEETGDPRYAVALRAEVEYAKKYIRVDDGQCRNIGVASDFVGLYCATGLPEYRDEALRMFRELRTKLSAGDLFSQGGEPIVDDPPFIDDDDHGYKAPFAKPYIIGYALEGLPTLMSEFPDEPKLRDVVRAVADFLASSQDPAGGWRYPHPASARVVIQQGIEHAAQLVNAARALEARGEDIAPLLNAIERTLQARVMGFARTGKILAGVSGWELSAGVLTDGKTIYDLYKKPADRDPSRDYTEGAVSYGGAPPEGLVYFPEVLAFYLAHRPAERLFNANAQLKAVLDRMPEEPPTLKADYARPEVLQYGVRAMLPSFRDTRVTEMTFPLAYEKAGLPFAQWRRTAREAYLACLGPRPPLAPFDPQEVAVEDRGEYVAKKIAMNISAYARAEAYLLVPKGAGPFPAVIALHDHGAHFSIGKEKMIRPFGVSEERMKDAADWVNACYGGRFVGDELAKRGYVVFSIDALFWGDRGRQEGVDYDGQQALASNMYQLGCNWAGQIVWDDVRSAEFVQGLPEVNPDRIGCVGLSMGSHRTWSLAAATDIVKAGAAICWMGDTPALTGEGNNQTKGGSAFSMLLPGIRNLLDYPDVASIACPKSMLFYNGEQDGLFPLDGVRRSYEKMRGVWNSQNAGDKLVTKLWNVPHEFNQQMQDEAFAWMDGVLKK